MNREEQATIEMLRRENDTLRVINDSMARKLYRIVDECGLMLFANPTDEKVARIRDIALEQLPGDKEALEWALSSQNNVVAWMQTCEKAHGEVDALKEQLREQKRTTGRWMGVWLEDNWNIVCEVLEKNPDVGKRLRRVMGLEE